jgi:hypothetical protein
MTRTPHSARRILSALVISIAVAGLVPALAAPATAAPLTASASASTEAGKGKVKLDGKLGKDRVKVGEKVSLKGNLDVLDAARADGTQTLEAVIVQQLQAGVWVNLANTSCRPNGGFSFSLSFSLSATISLRLYHPETTLYAAAYSSTNLTLRVG